MSIYVPPIRRVERTMWNGTTWHEYLDANDQRIPGVTTIISKGFRKPDAMVSWAGTTVAEVACDDWDELGQLAPHKRFEKLRKAQYTERDKAAKRGTEVHALAAKLVLGEQVYVPPELRAHVDNYCREFLDRYNPLAMHVESGVVHLSIGYAGTYDLLFEIEEDLWIRGVLIRAGVYLGDIKTAKSGIYWETAVQECGYARAEYQFDSEGNLFPMPKVDYTVAIHVTAEGVRVLRLRYDDVVWQTFGRGFKQAQAMDQHEGSFVGAAWPEPENLEAAG